ncbi:hypothetical protein K438DRAFT_1766585 [Mycena galopus ATCC 62051]|nr:hypothetical protein K438DRAFT_1766585 [Mycena galopus ATCC 62051]
MKLENLGAHPCSVLLGVLHILPLRVLFLGSNASGVALGSKARKKWRVPIEWGWGSGRRLVDGGLVVVIPEGRRARCAAWRKTLIAGKVIFQVENILFDSGSGDWTPRFNKWTIIFKTAYFNASLQNATYPTTLQGYPPPEAQDHPRSILGRVINIPGYLDLFFWFRGTYSITLRGYYLPNAQVLDNSTERTQAYCLFKYLKLQAYKPPEVQGASAKSRVSVYCVELRVDCLSLKPLALKSLETARTWARTLVFTTTLIRRPSIMITIRPRRMNTSVRSGVGRLPNLDLQFFLAPNQTMLDPTNAR